MQVAPPVQQALCIAMQLSWAVQLMLVFWAAVVNKVPHDCTPPHCTLQVLVVLWHSSTLHDCRPGHLMSQLVAWHTIAKVEQA